jgi:hypothetical protein
VRRAGIAPRHVVAGVFIAVLYGIGGLIIDGDPAPTVLGGLLAGVLAVLVLRDMERRRRRRSGG